MDTANLDAMFDDMLGELDIISQQLMDDTIDKAPPPKPSEKDTNRSSSYSQSSSSDTSSQSYTRPPQVNVSADSEVDIDLSAMLSDLTDWEHNLTSGQGQMPSKKSASQDSGIGFNGNSLPRNTNLSAQYGMDGSPQFSTLKRATTGGPSVTFGDDEDELSLQSLEKDMEEEKRKQDKSRQLSAEELAALSPVMQELDDLVSDLSNLSFEHEYNLKRKSNDKKDSKLSPGITNGHLPPQDHHDDVFNNHVPHVFDETEKSVSHDSKPAIPPCVPPKPQTAMPHVAPENASSVSSESKTSSSNTSVTRQSNPAFQEDISKFDAPDSPVTPNNVLNAARHFESAAQNQVQKSYSPPKQTDRSPTHIANGPLSPRQQQDNTLVNHQTVNGYPHQNSINNSKPPVPPPTALKPKVPDKPRSIDLSRQRSFTGPPTPAKPTTPIKRQASVKAPANLSNILERQLQHKNSFDENQGSPTGAQAPFPGSQGLRSPTGPPAPIPGVKRSPMGPPAPPPMNHHNFVPNRTSLIRQNSAEIRIAPPQNHTVLARKHSMSRTSMQSNASTNSVMSTKSNSSAESDLSRHSADYTNEKASQRYSFAPDDIKRQLDMVNRQADIDNLSPEEREERIKAEKMRIALEKLKEARIQKLVVKVFNKDDSSKTLVVDERMTTRSVVRQLLEKNHYEPSINWALIEELPSLFMERIFEEHESVTEMLSFWTRDTTNQVRFLERKDKYALFRNPQHYLLSTSDSESQMAERQKQTLVEEFFSGRSGTGVPEVQGILYVKGDSKSWSRKYCVLRTSGLYCSKSGEPKKGKKVSDLQCLVMFEHMCVYLGRGWKKKHKSPTDYGFALKHPAIQTKSKHIKYFCCDDVRSLMRWIVGIRCAKYGKQLKDNYDKTNEEMKATPVSAMTFHAQQPDTTSNVSTDSGEAGSRQNSMPRASLTNVFEGAWQRANQQESSDGANEGPAPQRAKSVWKPQQAKTNSNWWDLGAAPELEELVETTPNMSNRTSATSNVSSVIQNRNHRTSTSSTGSRGSVEVGTPTFVPPPPAGPSAHSVAPPPPMMNRGMEYNAPPSPRDSSQQPSSVMHKGAPPPPPFKKGPPPPPMKPMGPPQPQMKFPPRMPLGGFRPPMPGAKPHSGYSRPPPSMMNNDMPPPPPPSNDDLPPPPPMDDMPPPPPSMDDLPPPPSIEEDMPLPPPMAINSHPGLPKGLRTVDGQAPVRLPFLPMFKNGNAFGGMRGPPPPGPKPGGPPPPPKKMAFPPHNHNYSNNNAPPLMPRNNEEIVSNVNNKPKPRSPSYSSHSLHRKPSNPNFRPDENAHYPGNSNPSRPSLRAPLTHYYTSDVTQTASVSYTKDDFPPPPDFILDLKDTFYHINHNDPSTRDLSPFDLPPPPPELLLNQVKNRSQPQPPPQKAKPAPPPPKRSPSTRLSAKRR
uniref:ras-associated and pleckstrin homology domains-containing protein 1-like isoform X1 n=1 Tax=Styela clava TaxID=7725 RepID=UPI0019397BBB|nr:ras-associated and pleckstrin homology domains-containing protein 1-like isoform X1 [Styela clava]